MPLQVKSLAEWEREGIAGMLSVVIPAHDEEGRIAETVERIAEALENARIRYEILVVNDSWMSRKQGVSKFKINEMGAYSDDVGRAFRLMSATHSNRSRPAVPMMSAGGGGAPAGRI
jgi:hypothetical protein